MMKAWSATKNIIYKADFFYTPQLLRVKQQPQYKTLFGGIVSISIMIVLLITFYNKVIETLDMIIINSSMLNTNAEDPTNLILSTFAGKFFMVGVEVWHHNLNTGKRYFDLVLTNTVYNTGDETNKSVQYAFEPCTKQHWRDYKRAQDNFDRLKMNYWKCLPIDKEFLIHGKYASPTSRTLDFAIRKCTNTSMSDSRPCAPENQIDDFFAQNGNFYYTIYFLNPLINPQTQDYLSYYLQDSNYIIFDKNGGQQGQLWMQDFQIVTDNSILPFSNIQTQKGGIVSKNAIKNRYNNVQDTYATFFFFKSPNSKSINRTFQKIDQILSYIGGLFGTIAIILFIVNIYNGYSFQISMAGYLYKRQKQNENIFKTYNFFYFIGHMLYAILYNFKFKPDWPRMKRYHQCREEMLKQFDILYLYKRLNFLEKTIQLVTEDYQLKGLHLVSQISLDQAKSIRKSYKLKKKLFQQLMGIHQKNQQKTFQSMDTKLVNQNRIKNDFLDNSVDSINMKKKSPNINQDYNSFDGIQYNQVLRRASTSLSLNEQTKQLIQQDIYSSQQQSSSEQEENFIIESIRRLKRDQTKNRLSKNIWENIQPRIKQIIQPILKNVIEINGTSQIDLVSPTKKLKNKSQGVKWQNQQISLQRNKRNQSQIKLFEENDIKKVKFKKLNQIQIQNISISNKKNKNK